MVRPCGAARDGIDARRCGVKEPRAPAATSRVPRGSMDSFYAYALAILQGVTELFPISSLGHTVILPPLLGWPIDQRSPAFLPFVVVLHVGTAAALLLYFWRDWL